MIATLAGAAIAVIGAVVAVPCYFFKQWQDAMDKIRQLDGLISDLRVENAKLEIEKVNLSTKNTDLLSDNAELKEKISKLDGVIVSLQDEIGVLKSEAFSLKAEKLKIESALASKDADNATRAKYLITERFGCYAHKESGQFYCLKCLNSSPPIESPFHAIYHGDNPVWKCNNCQHVMPRPPNYIPKKPDDKKI